MIYLYAGLGMAMLLPILVGLQTAVSVAELEQGELAMQFEDQKVFKDLSDRQEVKTDLLEMAKLSFDKLLTEPCPGEKEVNGFSRRPASDCAFDSSQSMQGYVSRVVPAGGGWAYCIIPDDGSSKCPEEYVSK